MSIVNQMLSNKPLTAGLAACIIAQILKVVIDSCFARKLMLKNLFCTGGMPSSHSALVSAAATVIGLQHRFDSVYFAIAAIFSLIVMYDASHVRRSAGEQAKAINKIMEALMNNHVLDSEETMKVILGHSPLQVTIGGLLGVGIGILSMRI